MSARQFVGICLWCLPFVALEVLFYLSYRGHDARFHWFTHLFVGYSFSLVLMALVAWEWKRAVPFPLVWLVLGHLFAMFPDFLFTAGIAHQRWMDVFLGHLSSHFVSGANWTWYLIFLAALALYLVALDRRNPAGPIERRSG